LKYKLKNRLKRFLWLFIHFFHRHTKEEKYRIKTNKRLVKQFPFLLPKDRFYGEVLYDYDYTYTELDEMPIGWRNSFGIEMCEEIKKCLLKANFLRDYTITQIKEKFGTLRWYDNGVPDSISEEFHLIINYYEDKSMLVCLECGKPTKYVTTDWIEYLCEEHLKERLQQNSKINYLELTWKHIPKISYNINNKVIKVDSELKGEMMCTWKRHSKHNKNMRKDNVTAEDSKEDFIKIKTNYLWKQE